MKLGLLIILSFLPASVSAHAGGGPPFLRINNQYIQNNPFYGVYGNPAQDADPRLHVINQPLTFAVDTNILGNVYTNYRWKWTPDATTYDDGVKVDHTFTKPGTYVVTVQAEGAILKKFEDLDTVQVNVAPKPNYALPTARIAMNQTGHQGQQFTAHFSAETTHDGSAPLTDFTWKLTDSDTAQGPNIDQTYTEDTPNSLDELAYLRVTDSNGLVGDAALEITHTSGDKLTTVPFLLTNRPQSGTLPGQSTPATKKSTILANHSAVITSSIVLGLLILGAPLLLLRRTKS